MKMTTSEYGDFVAKRTPKSPVFRNAVMAWLFGGGICALSQALTRLYVLAGLAGRAPAFR